MKSMPPNLASGRLLALALTAAFAVPAFAQDDADRASRADRPTREDRAARDAASASPIERLERVLDLTEAQAAILNRAEASRGPAALWPLAADFARALTPAQLERIPDRPLLPERPPRSHGRPGADAEEAPSHRDDVRDARNRALGLTREQAAAIEQLVQNVRATRNESRPQPSAGEARPQRSADEARAPSVGRADRTSRTDRGGAFSEELASILTTEQEQIWRVHELLTMLTRQQHAPNRLSGAEN